MNHAVHREPWHADCPTCRETLDPGLSCQHANGGRIVAGLLLCVDCDAYLRAWPCSCQSGWRKPRPLWRRLLDALRRMR